MGRVRIFVDDQERALLGPAVLIGRRVPGGEVDVDLTPDNSVSRQHARIWCDDSGQMWVQDLGSKAGTLLNDRNIREAGPQRLESADQLRIGRGILRAEFVADGSQASPPPTAPLDPLPILARVTADLNKSGPVETRLQSVVQRLVQELPRAEFGSLLQRTEASLDLLAHYPTDNYPSERLAQEALDTKATRRWDPAQDASDPLRPVLPTTRSFGAFPATHSLYAPLVWEQECLGVISLENASADDFTEEEQQILEASAFQLGAVLKTELLLGELKRRDERIANFRRLVSRPVAARVLELDGRLRLSMQLCEVTVLFSDIRGFTRMAADMLPDDVTEMLEAYLSRLVPVIEQHGGAVDKFMGDGIMAVFASDTEDPDQPVHAVSAALGMLDAARVVSQERLRARQVIGELGIGIHRGRALQGFSGTRERMEFTAIGDVVNWASRISDGAGKSDLLVSKEVHERVWGKLRRTAAFERTTIPTKHEGDLVVYRVRPWVGQGGAAAGTETTAVPVVG